MSEAPLTADVLTITLHLLGALAAGAAIGLERSYHGRPAGFRTHSLVCVASSLLMLVTLYQWSWLPGVPLDTVRTDPTRMGQGIMTGIGFLGAGVIFKEGLSIRGLTTAASIWMTAAIGILMGIGFYLPAILGTLLTLGILATFRWLEARLPSHYYAHYMVRFRRDRTMSENEVRTMLQRHQFTIANMSYRIHDDSQHFEYRMTLRTSDHDGLGRLAEELRHHEQVVAFRLSPSGD